MTPNGRSFFPLPTKAERAEQEVQRAWRAWRGAWGGKTEEKSRESVERKWRGRPERKNQGGSEMEQTNVAGRKKKEIEGERGRRLALWKEKKNGSSCCFLSVWIRQKHSATAEWAKQAVEHAKPCSDRRMNRTSNRTSQYPVRQPGGRWFIFIFFFICFFSESLFSEPSSSGTRRSECSEPEIWSAITGTPIAKIASESTCAVSALRSACLIFAIPGSSLR